MNIESELARLFADIPRPDALEIAEMKDATGATQKWLDDARTGRAIPVRRKAQCSDGFAVSIQASQAHYCQPRDDEGPYWEVELGYPTQRPTDEIMTFAEDSENPTKTVYGYVPIELVDALIAAHGGIDPVDADEAVNGVCAQGDSDEQ
jgi:hypothetical protein